MDPIKVDFERLRRLYSESEVATAMLDNFAGRERNWGSTSVDSVLTNLSSGPKEVSRGDVIAVFRELESCGCGNFVTGRKGHRSRFEWDVQMIDVGKAAAGEVEQVDEVSGEEAGDEDVSLVKHVYRLRPDFSISVELPKDFTSHEATRFARFVQTLPFDAAGI